MHIAIITAGGAGMFCGSCMQDNSLAKALVEQGNEVSLIPTYTPIRVDQQNVSDDKVYLGGVNLYLDHTIPFWHRLPRGMVSWLDHPRVLRVASSLGIENDASRLGSLTLAMLQGSIGSMRREYQELVEHLVKEVQPDIIIFSNALLSGVMPLLREQFTGPVFCLLQGDDLFLDQLAEKYRQLAISSVAVHARLFDLFLTHTEFYADYMSEYLSVDRKSFRQIPLSIDLPDELHSPEEHSIREASSIPRIGYFARIAPEKGLLNLVQAVNLLYESGLEVELYAGGYLGKAHHDYMRQIEKECALPEDCFRYIGSPGSQKEKLEFMQGLDIFSVPALFLEPKGLYLLEAMSQGVPVAQPAHGSYLELIESTGGGLLSKPGSIEDLARILRQLLESPKERLEMGVQAQTAIKDKHTSCHAAQRLVEICNEFNQANRGVGFNS